jgi:hypothetical protein
MGSPHSTLYSETNSEDSFRAMLELSQLEVGPSLESEEESKGESWPQGNVSTVADSESLSVFSPRASTSITPIGSQNLPSLLAAVRWPEAGDAHGLGALFLGSPEPIMPPNPNGPPGLPRLSKAKHDDPSESSLSKKNSPHFPKGDLRWPGCDGSGGGGGGGSPGSLLSDGRFSLASFSILPMSPHGLQAAASAAFDWATLGMRPTASPPIRSTQDGDARHANFENEGSSAAIDDLAHLR